MDAYLGSMHERTERSVRAYGHPVARSDPDLGSERDDAFGRKLEITDRACGIPFHRHEDRLAPFEAFPDHPRE